MNIFKSIGKGIQHTSNTIRLHNVGRVIEATSQLTNHIKNEIDKGRKEARTKQLELFD